MSSGTLHRLRAVGGGWLVDKAEGWSTWAKEPDEASTCWRGTGARLYMPAPGVTMGFENGDRDSALRTIYPIRDSAAVDTHQGAAGGFTPPSKRKQMAGLCFGGSSL